MKVRIVPYKEADEINYTYAICGCMWITEGIEIPRPEYTSCITINCPRCNKELNIVALGKVNEARGERLRIL